MAYSSHLHYSTDTVSRAVPGLGLVACVYARLPFVFVIFLTSLRSSDQAKDSIRYHCQQLLLQGKCMRPCGASHHPLLSAY